MCYRNILYAVSAYLVAIDSPRSIERNANAGPQFVQPFLKKTDVNHARRFHAYIVASRASPIDEPNLADCVLPNQIRPQIEVL
jgi:hypothetical protein